MQIFKLVEVVRLTCLFLISPREMSAQSGPETVDWEEHLYTQECICDFRAWWLFSRISSWMSLALFWWTMKKVTDVSSIHSVPIAAESVVTEKGIWVRGWGLDERKCFIFNNILDIDPTCYLSQPE